VTVTVNGKSVNPSTYVLQRGDDVTIIAERTG
jgi:ribosomal protein S4